MPPLIDGFWGQQTSTLDWCEENYVVSYYVAEFSLRIANSEITSTKIIFCVASCSIVQMLRLFNLVPVIVARNTVSNAVMIFAPLVMVFFGYFEKQEKRFIYSFLALAVVGIGSWLFHMTLKYTMQLMDELPMIWGTSFLIYSLYMIDSKPNEESVLLQTVLIIYCIIVTLVYILVNVPIFHQVSYGLMVSCIVILASKTLLTMKCDKKLYCLGLLTYGMGFLLWNVDNMFCSHLRSIRAHPVGQVSGMLFECHAWWHIFAGIGTYLSLLFGVHTRYVFLNEKPRMKFLLGCWPYISIKNDDRKLK